MRRRLVVLSLATTLLIVISFLVPLGLLVRRQAADSAKVGAEQDAQAVASLVALALAFDNDPTAIRDAVGDLPEGTIVVLPDGDVLGSPVPGQGTLAAPAAQSGSTVASDVDTGWEIALPVLGVDGVAVVDVFVSAAALREGVLTAWLLLALLGAVLVGVAMWVADRIGRRLTDPVEDLARSAHQLAEGDLDVRVEPQDPKEIREMGEAFNYLADRLDALLAEERESVADVSHRLRTPMTSLRLRAERLEDQNERDEILAQIDRLERSMSQVIELTRSRGAREPGTCDLNLVARSRSEFWSLLAEEQERPFQSSLAGGELWVPLSGDQVGVVIDTLIDNVFSHTPRGTPFGLRTLDGGSPALEVWDSGPGLDGRVLSERGVSGSGSTGLGLDIVRKTVSSVGGSIEVDDRSGEGTVIRIRFGGSV